MGILTLDDIAYSAGQTPLMTDVSLHMDRGEAVGVLGVNGAGKTTLFDLICGIKKPYRGVIKNASRRQTYLTQILTPPPLLRMSEAAELVICLNAQNLIPQSQLRDRLVKWSETLGKRYSEISRKRAAVCSYGEIRAFFTLTLLLMGSDLVVLDEPTAGVDPEFRHYIWLGIQKACEEGASVIVSSHYTEEITSNCNRFYMLAHRRLEAFDDADQFLARYRADSLDEAFVNASA